MAGFGLMFSLAFLAFAQLGHLLFGSQMQDFSTLTDAVFTLLRTILGDFNFRGMVRAQPLLGPAFFTVYVLVVFFVLLVRLRNVCVRHYHACLQNMFLAIINDTYSEVKAELALRKIDFGIGDYFERGYHNVLVSLGSRDKVGNLRVMNHRKILFTYQVRDIGEAFRTASMDDGRITYDEVRQNLKK